MSAERAAAETRDVDVDRRLCLRGQKPVGTAEGISAFRQNRFSLEEEAAMRKPTISVVRFSA